MVEHRVGFGQFVALALLGDDVQELRALEALQVLQGGDQGIQIMAVDGADVVEAQFFEQGARGELESTITQQQEQVILLEVLAQLQELLL